MKEMNGFSVYSLVGLTLRLPVPNSTAPLAIRRILDFVPINIVFFRALLKIVSEKTTSFTWCWPCCPSVRAITFTVEKISTKRTAKSLRVWVVAPIPNMPPVSTFGAFEGCVSRVGFTHVLPPSNWVACSLLGVKVLCVAVHIGRWLENGFEKIGRWLGKKLKGVGEASREGKDCSNKNFEQISFGVSTKLEKDVCVWRWRGREGAFQY